MIWDSEFWKRELLVRATAVRKRQLQKRWSSASFGRLERDVMLGFYAIRKLIEFRKVSDDVANRPVKLTSHRATGRRVTRLNWHRLKDLYDLDRSKPESRHLPFLCNQICHSYVFMPSVAPGGALQGILFASDREKDRQVFGISTERIAELFDEVGRNDPLYFAMRKNEKTGDYDVVVGRHVPPEEA